MKEFSFSMILAVLEEMFGREMFWALVAVAAVLVIALIAVVVRDGGFRGRRLLGGSLVAAIIGVGTVLWVQALTASGFNDLNGPIDILAMAGIWFGGAISALIVIYVAQGLLLRRR